MFIPGSRNGRGIPFTTPKNTPSDWTVSVFASTRPPVGATVVISATATRIPSYFSSWSKAFDLKSACVSITGFGSAFPFDNTLKWSRPTKCETSVIVSP